MTRDTSVTSSKRTQVGLVAALLLAAVILSLMGSRPPALRPSVASPRPGEPLTAFGTERAMAHVEAMARRPHPMGTPEHDAVRDYVERTLRGMALEVDVQRTTGVTAKYRDAGSVENVVARLAGRAPGHGAIMLAAHYDSVAAGPGAGDDAAGVAAILEAVRALRAGEPLDHDVIVLASDGEELGLLGASAFMAEHPWAKDVRVVVNFEARGSSGASSLFETSEGNGPLVDLAAGAVPGLVGSSLTYEVYKHMPNDTDATVFKAHGLRALNFGFVGGWSAYHTPQDDPGHLDRRSLQQHGEAALGLARALGDADLDGLAGRDDAFFSLPGGAFVHYAARLQPVFVAAAGVLLLLALVGGRAAFEPITLAGSLAGAGLFALGIAGCAGAALGGVRLAETLHGHVLPAGDVLGSEGYACGVALLALAVWGAGYASLRRRVGADALAFGLSLGLLLAALVATFTAPGAAYVLLFPALASAAALLAARAAPRARVAASAGLAVLVVALVVPLMHSAFEGLGVSAQGGAFLGALVALVAAACPGALDAVGAAWGPTVAALGLLGAGLAFAAGGATTRFDAAHPKASQMFYAVDADTKKATWASTAAHGDPWVDAYVGASPQIGPVFPGWPRTWRLADAETVPTPQPVHVRASEVDRDAATRTIRLDIHADQTESIGFDTFASVVDAEVDGKPIPPPAPGDNWTLSDSNVTREGITLTLRVRGTSPLELHLTEHMAGLPEASGKPPRPEWTVSRHGGDQTIVHRTLTL